MVASKHIGRPLKFQSVEELQTAINAYFEDCDRTIDTRVWGHGPIIEKTGKQMCRYCDAAPTTAGCRAISGKFRGPRPYTVTGLALALDTTRQTLLNYEVKPEFLDTIKAAKQRIENYAEEALYDKDRPTRGVIFSLSNNAEDWVEKKDTVVRLPRDGAGELAKAMMGDQNADDAGDPPEPETTPGDAGQDAEGV